MLCITTNSLCSGDTRGLNNFLPLHFPCHWKWHGQDFQKQNCSFLSKFLYTLNACVTPDLHPGNEKKPITHIPEKHRVLKGRLGSHWKRVSYRVCLRFPFGAWLYRFCTEPFLLSTFSGQNLEGDWETQEVNMKQKNHKEPTEENFCKIRRTPEPY